MMFARHFCHPLHENGHPLHRQVKGIYKKYGMVLSDYRQESKYAVPIKIKRKGKPQEEESMRNAKVKKSNKILAAITAAMLAVTIGGTG